jgi:heme/copper-type cytochrome/quinol oxidase subunit 2
MEPNKPDNFDQKLVEKIKQENITPKPRWHFLFKDYVIWASGAAALLIGAAAVSVMMYLFKYNNWDIRAETHKSLWEFFLLTLPYFWIIFLGLFVFILYYNLKHTKRGYIYPIWLIASVAVLASVALGSMLFLANVGEKIDDILGERVPLYDTVINRNSVFWFNPAEGRLIGLVSEKNDDSRFEILDPRGNDWQVTMPLNGPTTEILVVGQPVDLLGQALDDHDFQARIVRPIRSGRGFLSRPHNHKNNPFSPPPSPPPPFN